MLCAFCYSWRSIIHNCIMGSFSSIHDRIASISRHVLSAQLASCEMITKHNATDSDGTETNDACTCQHCLAACAHALLLPHDVFDLLAFRRHRHSELGAHLRCLGHCHLDLLARVVGIRHLDGSPWLACPDCQHNHGPRWQQWVLGLLHAGRGADLAHLARGQVGLAHLLEVDGVGRASESEAAVGLTHQEGASDHHVLVLVVVLPGGVELHLETLARPLLAVRRWSPSSTACLCCWCSSRGRLRIAAAHH
mmetsp:Transcript_53282/g.127097  ORF Transcript_53282/g.127097 Transcript_53282/m.127097 type:complete len:251 (+) Transcript_53282:556-1308(+)